MMYLRHEAGHAFNYAYELYRTDEWRELFGSFRRPYRDDYPFVPFSRDYVRHIAGWYAQKHPDEDFAETFAVWLDPELAMAQALPRLGRAAQARVRRPHRREKLADMPPPRPHGETDITVDEMEQTVEEILREYHVDETRHHRRTRRSTPTSSTSSRAARGGRRVIAGGHARASIAATSSTRCTIGPASAARWCAHSSLAIERQAAPNLRSVANSREQMIELTVYITALSMTFLTGKPRLRHRELAMKIAILYNTFEGYEEYPGRRTPRPQSEDEEEEERRPTSRPSATRSAARPRAVDACAIDGRPETLTHVRRNDADLFFNLVESYNGDDTMEMHFAAYLDLIGKRYTGAGPQGSYLAMDKSIAKMIVRYHGLYTPYSAVVDTRPRRARAGHQFPVIVKPATEDASKGIDAGRWCDR